MPGKVRPTAKAAKREVKEDGPRAPSHWRVDPKYVAKKIQVTRLVQELHKVAFGEREITPEQLRAIDILLKKAVPDLKAVDITQDIQGTLEIVTNVVRNLD